MFEEEDGLLNVLVRESVSKPRENGCALALVAPEFVALFLHDAWIVSQDELEVFPERVLSFPQFLEWQRSEELRFVTGQELAYGLFQGFPCCSVRSAEGVRLEDPIDEQESVNLVFVGLHWESV